MSANTKIEWTDHTFNTHWGCSKISPACDNCYAQKLAARFGYGWGDDAAKREFGLDHWDDLLKLDRKAAKDGVKRSVFTNSMSDLFDKFAPSGVRELHWSYIRRTPNLIHLLLTKRIGNVAKMVPEAWMNGEWPENVWLGATVCNQAEADRDIPKLLAVPAAKRFLSIEPLLGPVDLRSLPYGEGEMDCLQAYTWEQAIDQWRGTSDDWVEDFEDWHGVTLSDGLTGPMHNSIDWVIVGGESGPSARPMHPDWVRGLRDQCNDAGVRFMFKQWGEWWEVDSDARDEKGNHIEIDPYSYEGREMWDPKTDALLHVDGRRFTPETLPDDTPARLMRRLGKKAAGRRLDGREWNEVPT